MGHEHRKKRFTVGLLVATATACGGATTPGSTADACEPGDALDCRCPDGYLSLARCEADGTVGVCRCEGGSDSGGTTSRGGSASGGSSNLGGTSGRGGTSGSSGRGGTSGSSGANGGTSGTGGSSGGEPGECSTRILPLQIVDVDYSASLDRLVMLGSGPNALVLVNPETLATVSVELPLLGSSISVAPDGKQAAVAHNGHVTIVDLELGKLTHTIATTTVAGDITLGNGFVYLFPESNQSVDVYSVNLATEEAVEANGGRSSLGKLHPSGQAMYGISVGSSPADIESYDISGGVVSTMNDSPYHGDYSMCGDIWISKDGLRIWTGCGTAFRASPGTDADMTYNGAFEEVPSSEPASYGNRYQSIAHDAVNSKVYALPARGRTFDETPTPEEATLRTFTYEFLTLVSTRPIPCTEANSTKYTMYGLYAFASADGAHVYVVARATNTPLLNDWGLAVLDVE